MQLRFATTLSAEQYICQKAWRYVKIDRCPLHPTGKCRFAKHGTYSRKLPEGIKIARWYCPDGHTTFSMLPDFLASRLPGTLIEVEAAIDQVDKAPSQEAAANKLRPDIGLIGVLRWMRRRLFLVRSGLVLLIELIPAVFNDCRPTLSSFQAALGVDYVLPALRVHAASHLHVLPPPIGFGPHPQDKKLKKTRFQHKTGTDPPSKLG